MRCPAVPFFISHQGCPHQCVFCDQKFITGAEGALPSAADMLARIAEWRRSAGNRPVEVAFFGGTFTSLPRSVMAGLLEPLQALLADGVVASVRISTRPDALDAECCRYLADHGVTTVELGVQSMDDNVLCQAGRGHDAQAVVKSVSLLREAGMAVGIQLMPGLPGDSPELAFGSFQRALALQPDFFRIYPTLVIAGTLLAEMYRRGAYQPLTLDEAIRICKIMLRESLASSTPIIRMGLQATDELSAGAVLAGPYHPAFRQLVESELFHDLAILLVRDMPKDSPVTLRCAPGRVADLVGQQRSNIVRLRSECGINVAAVIGDMTIARTSLVAESAGLARAGDCVADLKYSIGGFTN